MNKMIGLAGCILAAASITTAVAQDKAKGAAAEKPKAEAKKADKAASSDQRGVKVLFENDRVRVTETSYKPGADSGMVQRSDRVVRALTDGTLEKTTPDGKKETIQWKTGQVRYGKKETYSQKNVGKTDLVLFVTNLK